MEVWGPSAQKALGVGVLLLPHRRSNGGGPSSTSCPQPNLRTVPSPGFLQDGA